MTFVTFSTPDQIIEEVEFTCIEDQSEDSEDRVPGLVPDTEEVDLDLEPLQKG